MLFTAHVSFKAEKDAKWTPIAAPVIERKTQRGARADALALFALMAPAHPALYARIVKTTADESRKVVETLEVP